MMRWTCLILPCIVVLMFSCSPFTPPRDLAPELRPGARFLAIPGTHNLRDLGGYSTSDRRTTRWGVLYRSDALNKVDQEGKRRLAQLGIQRVVDFRSTLEGDAGPDQLPPGLENNVVRLPIFDANNALGKDLKDLITGGKAEGIDPVAFLTQANVDFVRSYTKEYGTFLREVLAAGGQPVLFHCTAGKDRAGFASALLLGLAGVPEPTILEDYLLSDKVSRDSMALPLFFLRLTKGAKAASVVEGFLAARPEYLMAALGEIRTRCGSFEAYAVQGLGLSPAEVAQLRDLILEPRA